LKLKTASQYRRLQSINCNLSPVQRFRGSFIGTERPESEADQSSILSPEVKKVKSHYLQFPIRLYGTVLIK
jgi:hypothetical protein